MLKPLGSKKKLRFASPAVLMGSLRTLKRDPSSLVSQSAKLQCLSSLRHGF